MWATTYLPGTQLLFTHKNKSRKLNLNNVNLISVLSNHLMIVAQMIVDCLIGRNQFFGNAKFFTELLNNLLMLKRNKRWNSYHYQNKTLWIHSTNSDTLVVYLLCAIAGVKQMMIHFISHANWCWVLQVAGSIMIRRKWRFLKQYHVTLMCQGDSHSCVRVIL